MFWVRKLKEDDAGAAGAPKPNDSGVLDGASPLPSSPLLSVEALGEVPNETGDVVDDEKENDLLPPKREELVFPTSLSTLLPAVSVVFSPRARLLLALLGDPNTDGDDFGGGAGPPNVMSPPNGGTLALIVSFSSSFA